MIRQSEGVMYGSNRRKQCINNRNHIVGGGRGLNLPHCIVRGMRAILRKSLQCTDECTYFITPYASVTRPTRGPESVATWAGCSQRRVAGWQFNWNFWPPKSWPNSSPTLFGRLNHGLNHLGHDLGGQKFQLNCHPDSQSSPHFGSQFATRNVFVKEKRARTEPRWGWSNRWRWRPLVLWM